MDIMRMVDEGSEGKFRRISYFINCPLDSFDLNMDYTTEVKVIEIPRQLAEYIEALQNKVVSLGGML